jgi:hypothetical protein
MFFLKGFSMNYFIERAKEPSTWRGVILLLAAIGVPIAPDLAESIIAVGMALAGLIGVFTSDKQPKN